MKLRYVLVFAIGMACMYWLVRSGVIGVGTAGVQPLQPDVISGDTMVDTNDSMGSTDLDLTNTDSTVSSGDLSTTTSGSQDIVSGTQDLDDTVAIIQGTTNVVSDTNTPSNVADTTSSAAVSKVTACQGGQGVYAAPIMVDRTDGLTATTRGYTRLRNFIHYVVFVSDGTKYYYYYNCDTGTSTNAQNVTNTIYTSVVSENGQVYLR